MAELQLEEVQRRRHPSNENAAAPVVPSNAFSGEVSVTGLALMETDDVRAWLEGLKEELDVYYAMGKKWAESEPDVVMGEISSIVARLVEIRAHLFRDNSARANKLRLNEIDPLLDKLELQFKIHSRQVSVRKFDWDVVRGAET